MTNRELTAAPEVRFNPANGAVAVRTIDSAYSSTPWRGIVGHLSDDDVADWTPMAPAAAKDAEIKRLRGALVSIECAAERAERKGYDLDAADVLDDVRRGLTSETSEAGA